MKPRLTRAFGLAHPVISAPMAFAAGAAGVIHDSPPAGAIIEHMVSKAETLLKRGMSWGR